MSHQTCNLNALNETHRANISCNTLPLDESCRPVKTNARRASILNNQGLPLSGISAPDEVKSVVDQYTGFHNANLEHRKEELPLLVNHYYDLVTDFYEFGWGRSFHFAPRQRGESFKLRCSGTSIFLADQLSLKPGMQILDVGCGIGGPMGNPCPLFRASFVGINNNAYQIERAKEHTRDVQSLCRFIRGDYMQIPESDNCFDGAFAIEATPHAPNKTAAFKEVYRVLRPGACFAGYEWCLTDNFDPQNRNTSGSRKTLREGMGCRTSLTHRKFVLPFVKPDSKSWKPATLPLNRIRTHPGIVPCRVATSALQASRAHPSARLDEPGAKGGRKVAGVPMRQRPW